MSLLGAFDATWTQARATFGQGTPDGGDRLAASSRQLAGVETTVDGARPGAHWSGAAAESYAAANNGHARVIGETARLDGRLASELSRSAAVIEAGRNNLDAVRSWVHDAASRLPQTAAGQRLLVPIVQRGLSDVAALVQRSTSEFDDIARRVKEIGAQYDSLNNQLPAPDVATLGDTTTDGKAQRPLADELTAEEWRIARLSPTLLDQYAQAKAQGWTFTSNPGEGTYTNFRDKVINIDPALTENGPHQRVNALAHELGHALHSPPEDRSSKDAFVTSMLDGEGAATMNTMKIEREILAAGGPDIIPAAAVDDGFEEVYDAYVAAGSTPEAYQAAIRQIGNLYGDLTPSTDTSVNYREYYGRQYR